jgi:hypothetical protein
VIAAVPAKTALVPVNERVTLPHKMNFSRAHYAVRCYATKR